MPAPTEIVAWSTDANYTNGVDVGTPTKVEPSAGVKAEGHVPGTPLPAQRVNWWQNAVAKWIQWLESERADHESRLDGADSDIAELYAARSRHVRMLAADARYDQASWTPSFHAINGNVVSSEIDFDFGPLLEAGARINKVHVLVNPASARATPSDRMSVILQKVSHGSDYSATTTETRTTVGTATDDGTTNRQWVTIDLSGAPLDVDGGLGSAGCSWVVHITHGNDTGFDEVAVAVVEQVP